MRLWTLALAFCLSFLAIARVLHADPEQNETLRVAEDDSSWEESAPQEEPEATQPAPEEEPPPPPPEE